MDDQTNASGASKLKSMPLGWEFKDLIDVATLQRGKDLPIDKRLLGSYPVVGSNGVVGYHSEFVAQGPGVLVGRSGSVGKVTLVMKDFWPLNTTLWVKDFHGNDPNFVYYLLSCFDFSKYISGVSVPTLNRNLVHPVKVGIPPLPEQRAIARVLRVVQAAREARLREIALERERKAALMEHLFAPTDWRIVPLEECAFVQTGVTKGRKLDDNNRISVPYLRVANVQDGYLDLDEIQTIEIRRSELERFLLQPNDILLTEGGDFDKLGRGFIWQRQIDQCIHQNHIFAVRVDKNLLVPEFLSYLIQSEYGKNYFLSVAHRTTHLACINSTKLKAFPTLVPDLERQKEIADSLNTCDAKIVALENEASLHDELFRAMLEEMMCGELSAKALEES